MNQSGLCYISYVLSIRRELTVPCSAGTLLPETGASRYLPPLALIPRFISFTVCSSTVDISTNAFEESIWFTNPSSPKTKSFAALGSFFEIRHLQITYSLAYRDRLSRSHR